MSNSSEFAAMSPKHVSDSQDNAFSHNRQESNKLNDEAAQLLSDRSILNNIDRAARTQDKPSDAAKKSERVDAQEAALLKELAAAEKKYGKVSKETAAIFERLGMLCMSQERNDKAKEYVEKAVKIYDIVYGKDSLASAGCHTVLGELYVQLGKNKEAAQEFETALNICRKYDLTKNKTAASLFLTTATLYINDLLNKTGDEKRLKELFREMGLVLMTLGSGTLIRNPDGTVSISVSRR